MTDTTGMTGMTELQRLEAQINSPIPGERRSAWQELGGLIREGKLTRKVLPEVNNHVHTTLSFSPYQPAAAAYQAWKAGLGIVGSIDHDSIGAAEEMLESAAALGIASTVGFELRAGVLDTALADRKINNPDSKGIIYMCVHGIPRQHIADAAAFLRPVGVARERRNRSMVQAFNALGLDFKLDYDADVLPLSRARDGGSVTERHILYALALKMIESLGRGSSLVRYLREKLGLDIPAKIADRLSDSSNVHYAYDLLGVLKSSYMPRFYIQPGSDECISAREVVRFGLSIGAIPAYAYLGDVSQSPTGDKKAERFEDGFLDELLDILVEIGFPAVTYMPPRNTPQQMERLQEGCRKRGLMEISGVDINSSRQSFNCPEMLMPICSHLVDSAWALVAHEKLSAIDLKYGLFADGNPLFKSGSGLDERIRAYSGYGRALDPFDPFGSSARLAERLCGGV